jgi:hypothetical protein
VIIQTSHIISRTIKSHGNPFDFVGHVGGDDFVFITTPDKEEIIALEIIKEFDRLILYHYTQEDRARGSIEIHDRQNKLSKMPLMSISVALINNVNMKINSLVELSEIAFEIKSHLKTIEGSKFLKNRRIQNRGKQIRTKQADALRKQIKNIERSKFVKPLGQLLLEADLINKDILEDALVRHWRTGQNLGQTLVGMGLVKEDDILNMLKLQIVN